MYVCIFYFKVVPEILNIYENEFNRLSDRYFKEFPWPEAKRIAPFVDNGIFLVLFIVKLYCNEDEIFLILFEELRYRHIYAKHKVLFYIDIFYSLMLYTIAYY